MLLSFYTQTITRLRPTETTSRGSTIYDWTDPDELEIPNCSVQPASTSLTQDGRVQGISDGLTVFADADADIVAGDRIVFNGETYTINGDPLIWPAPGRLQHMQLNLTRWRG